ncbi:DUF4340 domain-containing protein [Methylobacillus flagellatus]|uniref:DUF4340 domain-containing protein n=1 Tax=Methylobacillus flagellatus TaxID=405 RepID=UPI0010F4B24E|nr:DUF4340 domain-containing protein [Methylobacillus flagellatus]
MRARWLINLLLLVLVAGIASFLYLRPQTTEEGTPSFELSERKLGDFSRISVEEPSRAAVVFEKVDGYWYINKPYKARADQAAINRILSIVAARTNERFPAEDLARFGLDKPRLSLKLDDQEFLFGTFNPVNEQQYVAHAGSVFLVENTYEQYATTQIVELIDKSPLKPTEKVVGFDFSWLEQWQELALKLDRVADQWQVSVAGAKPEQQAVQEWFDAYWVRPLASSVEPYIPNRQAEHPTFQLKMQDGSKVQFEKLQESPELLLGRPDEGMLYHFPMDAGFAMLNPPAGIKP